MDGFPFTCSVEVRYRDVDAMNHVNNAVYVTYLEVARMQVWRRFLGFAGSAREVPFIVARVAVDFRAPLVLGADVEVGIRVSRIGNTSFTFAYRLEQAGELAAEAESVQVLYDYERGRPVPIDAKIRTRLASLEGSTAAS